MPQSDLVFNDFVLKFANVNGSGSASANLLCAKTLFRMGIPVAAKNIFPSNIQGLPTWYEIRASEVGHLARREGVDIMVAMNPASYVQDVMEISPGGLLVYDNTRERERYECHNWASSEAQFNPLAEKEPFSADRGPKYMRGVVTRLEARGYKVSY